MWCLLVNADWSRDSQAILSEGRWQWKWISGRCLVRATVNLLYFYTVNFYTSLICFDRLLILYWTMCCCFFFSHFDISSAGTVVLGICNVCSSVLLSSYVCWVFSVAGTVTWNSLPWDLCDVFLFRVLMYAVC